MRPPFPIQKGRYEVSPGLHKLDLSKDQIFWVTEKRQEQLEAKLKYAAKRKPLAIAPGADAAVIEAILKAAGARFLEEHPDIKINLGHRLGMQIQEDLAIVQETETSNRLIYAHVSFPSGWDPAEKIGLDFAQVHEPVAHFESMAANQDKIVKAMIDRGPYERFAWGTHTETDLDRIGCPDQWEGCDPGEVVLRVERQTTWGFPEYRAALFTIHTMMTPLKELEPAEQTLLAQALEGMDAASLAYKGLSERHVEHLSQWLRSQSLRSD